MCAYTDVYVYTFRYKYIYAVVFVCTVAMKAYAFHGRLAFLQSYSDDKTTVSYS